MDQSTRSSTGPTPAPQRLLGAYGLGREDLERIARLSEHCDPRALVDAFYVWLEDEPWHRRFFSTGVPSGVKSSQVHHWARFLEAVVDESYVSDRLAVGRTHARIDLPPDAFATAMSFSRRWLGGRAEAHIEDPRERAATIEAVAKLCELDSGLVMGAYFANARNALEAESIRVKSINQEIERVVSEAASGRFRSRYQPRGGDASVAAAVNQMLDSFTATIEQVRAVVEGDYQREVAPRSDDDELGNALLELTRSLREAREETRRNDWLRDGQTELFERLRGELDPAELGRRLLEYLCPRLGIPVGVVYSAEADADALRRTAVYGIRREGVQVAIPFGEGLLGEAALQRRVQFDCNIAQTPVKTTFGLGEVQLDHLSIIPLVADERLCGILQLATQGPMDERSIEWLQLVVESIAISLDAADSRARMRALLEQSSRQSEELRAQAEELKASNEELEVARTELYERNIDLKKQQVELESASTELEQRAAELDQASKYKSEFLANISHELRTPLNSMLLISEGMAANPQGNLDAHQLEALRLIHSGGQDLLRIISDILDLSKVEAGYLRIHPARFEVSDLLDNLRKQFEPVAKSSGLQLELETGPDTPTAMVTDVHRVEQILKNLLANALKFTPEGEVRLRVDAAGSGRVRFAVSDTGIGIPESQQRAIFEAFRQADGSDSRTYGGTGLGLTISRQLSELLKGQLTMSSEEGVGSEFVLELPVDGFEAEAASPPTRPPPRRTPPRRVAPPPAPVLPARDPEKTRDVHAPKLLIAEDDPTFAQTLAGIAEQAGYQPVIAATGQEALVQADQLRPSGILLDLGLPDIDGMRVLEQLKSNLSTRHIPVHVVSGYECKAEVLQLGAVGFLSKPFEREAVERILERFQAIEGRARGRVLVVEDHEATQFAIRETLGDNQVDIHVVASGEAALEALKSLDFDCMVLDLDLPDMKGQELIERLPDPHPPIVVYTATDPSDEKLEELALHTKQVILKGARSPDRLLDEVSLFLHQVGSELAEPQRETLQRLYDPSAALDQRKVLVVDDDMRNVFALTHLLQQQGMHVLQAKNGEIALEKLDRHPDIDLVITDIMMPVMDGFELIRRVRKHTRHAGLPVIAVTAKSLPEDRDACLEAGANDYISKPMSPGNLLSLMRVLLYSGREAARGV